ncbi:unnamed protein product [Hymenolepis diminuta]|uniref:ANK_REP_REGION domain-containing protein n=1 Tax=Hymenolepis diminuta TaxID=6216 RepID=A0A0R3SUH6_HYMDI|nr:unnamed protein product [Hymenolepis diminuta]
MALTNDPDPLNNQSTPAEDYSTWDIVKATQYGIFSRVLELVEPPPNSQNPPFDVNQLDNEGVSLLHWAAINNNFTLVKYLISKGAIIDRIGGNQHATALHWAIRKHLLEMVGLLVHFGANPMVRDIQGMTCLHVAAQEGATSIVLYLLAKGVDVNCDLMDFQAEYELKDKFLLSLLAFSYSIVKTFLPFPVDEFDNSGFENS